MRWLPSLEAGTGTRYAPFKNWKYYSDCLNYLRDTNEISESDKEWIMGKSIAAALKWPEPEASA